jgi:hypothetical protein
LSQRRKLILSEVEDWSRALPEDIKRPYRAAIRKMVADSNVNFRADLLYIAAVCVEWVAHIDLTAEEIAMNERAEMVANPELPKLRKLPDGTWTDGLRHPEWDAIKG